MTPIVFGTDGWRGIIGADFTRENVGRVARAVACALHDEGTAARGAVVGYDRRFLSARMAHHVAEELAAAGIPVSLSTGAVTTPAVSLAVVDRGHAGGLMVTASHNPPEYNGIKVKSAEGGSASEEQVARIAARVDATVASGPQATITEADIASAHLRRLSSMHPSADARQPLRIVLDTMHGSAAGVAGAALRAAGHDVIEIRDSANPMFGGVYPEPIPPHIHMLQRVTVAENADLGIALDGDGDRIGAVTSVGEFFSPHRVLSLMALAALRRGEAGRIVKTVSTTGLLDRIGADMGAAVTTTLVGFKHIAGEIAKGDVLVGGEESGGIWAPGYIPERDGIRIGLILAEAVASLGRALHDEWAAITSQYGSWEYARRDLAIPAADRSVIEAKAKALTSVGGAPVERVDTTDGVKLLREDGYWLMFRFSGTEPVLRLYAEGSSPEMCEDLLGEADALVAAASA
jgi:phosphomannomutase